MCDRFGISLERLTDINQAARPGLHSKSEMISRPRIVPTAR